MFRVPRKAGCFSSAGIAFGFRFNGRAVFLRVWCRMGGFFPTIYLFQLFPEGHEKAAASGATPVPALFPAIGTASSLGAAVWRFDPASVQAGAPVSGCFHVTCRMFH